MPLHRSTGQSVWSAYSTTIIFANLCSGCSLDLLRLQPNVCLFVDTSRGAQTGHVCHSAGSLKTFCTFRLDFVFHRDHTGVRLQWSWCSSLDLLCLQPLGLYKDPALPGTGQPILTTLADRYLFPLVAGKGPLSVLTPVIFAHL